MKTTRILIILLLIAPSVALAFTAQTGDFLNISTPIADDLYAAGNHILVEGSITGDLIMAGADVSTTGDVSESVMAAGANLDIGGKVGDDLRAAGGNIHIHSTIAGDAVLAGGSVDLRKETTVYKDLVVMAGNVYLDGNISGKAQITASKVYLNGTIGRDATITAQEIIVGSGASIRGNLIYMTPAANPALEKITTGTKQFTESRFDKKGARDAILAFVFAYTFLKILFLTVFGFLLLFFFEKFLYETSDILRKSPWTSLFAGIAFFVLLPIAAFILALTIIGIPVSALLITLLIFMFVFYELLGTIVWSTWTLDRYMKGPKEPWWKKLLVIFGFSIAFAVISGIDIVPAWMAIGALLTRKWTLVKSIRK